MAACGGKGGDQVAHASTSGLSTLQAVVLGHARRVPMASTTAAEIAKLRPRLSDRDFTSVQDHGLAAFLVAGPALETTLFTGRRAGEDPCPEGSALVHAAIDWVRCGRSDPIDERTLRRIWPDYLPPGTRATNEAFDRGLDWALRPVAGSIALVRARTGYEPYDYVDPAPDLRVQVARALVNKGIALGKLNWPSQALDNYDKVLTRFGDDPHPTCASTSPGHWSTKATRSAG